MWTEERNSELLIHSTVSLVRRYGTYITEPNDHANNIENVIMANIKVEITMVGLTAST